MPLDIIQYHPIGIDNCIFNSFETMKAFLLKSKYISPGDAVPYWVDHVEQEQDQETFVWDLK